MRLRRIVARGFRNLAPTDLEIPGQGVALLGANGAGKTNLLEAIYYPVLFRSFRGAADTEVARFGGEGFHVEVTFGDGQAPGTAGATWTAAGREKKLTIDGAPVKRLASAAGRWLAVAFLPSDTGLSGGAPSERRQYLDRMLALASPDYLRSLARYRQGITRRNAALRKGEWAAAQAFEPAIAAAGSVVVAGRIIWSRGARGEFAREFAALGESLTADLTYAGDITLADPAAWSEQFKAARDLDRQRGSTSVGPHRDDLKLTLAGKALGKYGSTGQQRSAAIALKLLELATLREARAEEPALILDDVFAELDRDRQAKLADRLTGGGVRQALVSSPRLEELPGELKLPVWSVEEGRVTAR
ncbi:MAG TPA: DNA replication and repair protein RecF [Gemmatimonadales bacterium]|nr:DNA replication and repair protein RecF [Gemmatimonadales bacterium]